MPDRHRYTSDLGVTTTTEIIGNLRRRALREGIDGSAELKRLLKEELRTQHLGEQYISPNKHATSNITSYVISTEVITRSVMTKRRDLLLPCSRSEHLSRASAPGLEAGFSLLFRATKERASALAFCKHGQHK